MCPSKGAHLHTCVLEEHKYILFRGERDTNRNSIFWVDFAS